MYVCTPHMCLVFTDSSLLKDYPSHHSFQTVEVIFSPSKGLHPIFCRHFGQLHMWCLILGHELGREYRSQDSLLSTLWVPRIQHKTSPCQGTCLVPQTPHQPWFCSQRMKYLLCSQGWIWTHNPHTSSWDSRCAILSQSRLLFRAESVTDSGIPEWILGKVV